MRLAKPEKIIFTLLVCIFLFGENITAMKQLGRIRSINYMDRVDEPVIGIVTLPVSPYFKRKFGKKYKGMIPTSYKKWIESTGARAVAIPHFASMSEIKKIINQINGLLLPGGKSELKR